MNKHLPQKGYPHKFAPKNEINHYLDEVECEVCDQHFMKH